MRPLSDKELKKIKIEKAKAAKKNLEGKIENEICSICCDEIAPKTYVRRMPECKHMFHQKCIDNWLKMKPTCPNCNRKTREVIRF
jgi:hypothetical protein